MIHCVVVLSRYDYDNVDIDAACEMMEDLEILISDKSFTKQRFAVEDKIYQVEKADSFEYTDPVDSTISRNQVLYTPTYKFYSDRAVFYTDVRCARSHRLKASHLPCLALFTAGSTDNLL